MLGASFVFMPRGVGLTMHPKWEGDVQALKLVIMSQPTLKAPRVDSKSLQDVGILECHNHAGEKYLGSCRMFLNPKLSGGRLALCGLLA